MAEEPKAKPKMADNDVCPYCLYKSSSLEGIFDEEGRWVEHWRCANCGQIFRRLRTTPSN